MVSIWQNKKGDGSREHSPHDDIHGESSGRVIPGVAPGHSVEPDERSRLLPPTATREGREGYLSPDDPAVSPYNLWSVRFMRYITVLLLVVTFVWWVILLVSIFVSPPGLHSRGSGFFDFSYTSLAFANLLVLLLFFASPSKATQITCLATSVLLLVDMIMIVAIPRLRVEEGWVGIASVIWALLVSIWVVVTDRVVQYGKQEEEERLTGRAESRRTMSEWLAVLVTEIVLVAIGLVIFLMSCTLIIRARDASLPVPGERYYVDGDKFQLHLYCSDPANPHSNLPTILFEAGERPFGHSFITVAENALKNGTINRYCYSDRPGFGWSDNAPSPFSAGMAVDVLSEALARAGEEGPWVLASAGVGSIYQRVFSSRKGESIRGILMVDPLHEDLLNRIGNTHHGFMLWLRGVLSPLGIDRNLGAVFRGRTREDRVYGRSAYQNGKYIKAKLQESLVAESLTKNEIGSARAIQRLDVPVAVISSGVQLRKDSVWEGKQRELTHITRNLLGWDIVENAGHQVWETLEGRTAIEKRLGELVREAAK